MSKPHVVTILSQKLTVRSDQSDEFVEKIAGFVAGRIEEVLEKTKSASMLTAALLVCLNIADDLHGLKKLKGAGGAKAAQKVREIIQSIDARLDENRQLAL